MNLSNPNKNVSTNTENRTMIYVNGHGNYTWQIYIPIVKKGDAQECSVYRVRALISHTGEVILKVIQQRLLPSREQEILDAQAGFRKERGT